MSRRQSMPDVVPVLAPDEIGAKTLSAALPAPSLANIPGADMVCALMREHAGFEISYRRHLAVEQRRAVLEAIARDIDVETTLGEIVDAAEELGWADDMGEVSLAQLAEFLLADREDSSVAELSRPTLKRSTSTLRDNHAAARSRPRGSRPVANGHNPTAMDHDALDDDGVLDFERMSLDRAVGVFVPLVGELGNATMQDLEDRTGVGRRKLRFHIGQLVKHGHLRRHGMGRGTYYTLA